MVRSSCPPNALRSKRTAGLARRWMSAGWTNKKNGQFLFGGRIDERRCIDVIYQRDPSSSTFPSLRFHPHKSTGWLPRMRDPNVRVPEPPSHFSFVRVSRCRRWITGFSTGQLVPLHPRFAPPSRRPRAIGKVEAGVPRDSAADFG